MVSSEIDTLTAYFNGQVEEVNETTLLMECVKLGYVVNVIQF
jgi:Holliday junction resolvasome RuvABC DNA-binding subunit